jgi:hypothetical protein
MMIASLTRGMGSPPARGTRYAYAIAELHGLPFLETGIPLFCATATATVNRIPEVLRSESASGFLTPFVDLGCSDVQLIGNSRLGQFPDD